MAYAALVSLKQTLDNFIQQDQYQIFEDDDGKRQVCLSLIGNIVLLQDFLEKFPGKANKLEPQIYDSANEMECLIECYISDMISSYGQVSGKDIYKLFPEINRVAPTIESIVQEMKDMGRGASADDGSTSDYLPRDSSQVHGKDKVLGFEDDLSKIKDVLFSDCSELVTIPIVGMGGVGKTTLARAAFDDPAIVNRFDLRRWATISLSYDIRVTYLALLGEDSSNDTTSIVDLSVKVHQLLKKRRYIIVIDDIWSSDVWDYMKRVMPDDFNKSRVLLTTRDGNVASYAASSSVIHNLQLMNEENSWRLFEQKVFGEEHCPPELVNIGKEITEGCGGLPLAISVIAGILSNMRLTTYSWEGIAKDVKDALSNGDEHFIEILSLSYYNLPVHLKHCFLYFGAFPENYAIRVSNLVKYFVGEGFLKADTTTNDVEEIAYRCLSDLVNRNLIMVTGKKILSNIKFFQIHDLLREMCIRICRKEKFLHHVEDLNVGARRASFTSKVSSQIINTYLSSLRTVICFQRDDNLMMNLQGLRLLRVFDARSIMLEKFPPQILQLYHLRYLAISYNDEVPYVIPGDICKLEKLETLIVRPKHFCGYVDVPPEILKLRNLRHLQVRFILSLPFPKGQTFRLGNLKTLMDVFNPRFVQHLVELIQTVRKLVVYFYLNHDVNEIWSDYHLHNLQLLGHLENLRIFLSYDFYDSEWCNQHPLLKSIVFPCSLRKLSICGRAARIPWEDVNNIIGSLPNLEELRLIFQVCSGDVWETMNWSFEKLRVLFMLLSDLKYWRTDSISHFPRLEQLHLGKFMKLIELPDCIGGIPTLQQIELDCNHKVVSEWASRIEEEQRDMGNDQLVIIRDDDYIQHILGEVNEWAEQLSVEEVAERLSLWAGDDVERQKLSFRIWTEYILLQSEEANPWPHSQAAAYIEAMTFMTFRMKKYEDSGEAGDSVTF